jgi:hypothetical protein
MGVGRCHATSLRARIDVSLWKKRLAGGGEAGPPALQERNLELRRGDDVRVMVWDDERLTVGDEVPLERIAGWLPLSLRWKTKSSFP